MVAFTKTIKIGDQNSGSMLGPIQNSMQYEKVKSIYQDSKEKGYKFAAGSPDFEENAKGFFAVPSIIDNPPDDSRIIQEEPFGPVSLLLLLRLDYLLISSYRSFPRSHGLMRRKSSSVPIAHSPVSVPASGATMLSVLSASR